MHPPVPVDRTLAATLHGRARADRWDLPLDVFQAALEASAARGLAAETRTTADVERYLIGLHLEDLALACACALGHDGAWEHFMRVFRPILQRAAKAIDPKGNSADLADSVYADLFGLANGSEPRRSLFRYFHGRSSLATWLRAVLSQRHVDRVRDTRRLDALPDENLLPGRSATTGEGVDRSRFLRLAREVLAGAVTALAPRDRLRLSSYYVHNLTLAEIGRLLGEHAATVSRHLARTRGTIRQEVERQLEEVHGLEDRAVREGFASLVEDAGPLDLADLLREDDVRNIEVPERST